MTEELRRTFPKKKPHAYQDERVEKEQKPVEKETPPVEVDEKKTMDDTRARGPRKRTAEDKACLKSFFSIVHTMEIKYGEKQFEWAELEREYRKRFDAPMPRNHISVALANAFGGIPRHDFSSFLRQLKGIFGLVTNTTEQAPVDCTNQEAKGEDACFVRLFPVGEHHKWTSEPRGRIRYGYEVYKKREVTKKTKFERKMRELYGDMGEIEKLEEYEGPKATEEPKFSMDDTETYHNNYNSQRKRTSEERACIKSFFSILHAMEIRHGEKQFEWAELEQEYLKKFKAQLPRDDISAVLATVFGGQPRRDARSFISQLRGIFSVVTNTSQQVDSNNGEGKSEAAYFVQFLPTSNSERREREPHGRIAFAYEVYKGREAAAQAKKEKKKEFKRMLKEHNANIDNDEPLIKKVKTEVDEEPKVKEEPEDPINEVEIKKEIKEEEPDHHYN